MQWITLDPLHPFCVNVMPACNGEGLVCSIPLQLEPYWCDVRELESVLLCHHIPLGIPVCSKINEGIAYCTVLCMPMHVTVAESDYSWVVSQTQHLSLQHMSYQGVTYPRTTSSSLCLPVSAEQCFSPCADRQRLSQCPLQSHAFCLNRQNLPGVFRRRTRRGCELGQHLNQCRPAFRL